MAAFTSDFDPSRVNLSTADPRDVICALTLSGNDYNGQLGARISALFVILVVSTVVTFFPVVAKRVPRLRIPLYVYLFARYFGAGVIVATAFIHLLDPAYSEIGPQTCVGMTGGWADYSWCPAIVLTSVMMIFLLDFGAERYVEMKFGAVGEINLEQTITDGGRASATAPDEHYTTTNGTSVGKVERSASVAFEKKFREDYDDEEGDSDIRKMAFRQQIAAFLILEFGVIFHSVVIGLNLGVVGSEFSTLYPVLVFHQSFEGLGIGARMSAIPFKRGSWLPWLLCLAYGVSINPDITVRFSTY
jgi:solute carrier family 39 (zinc transporter), member 1/2/3